jgi:hypothetical protein
MKKLKSGEVKYKSSTHKESDRLLGEVVPFPARRKGSMIEVYTGCGWAKGRVTLSLRDRCSVFLLKSQRSTACYDARNIRDCKES